MSRGSRVSRLSGLLWALLCIGGSADIHAAQPAQPNDFAWQWPLAIDAGQDVVRISLTPAIYAQITRADLRDLAAFNGANEGLPFGPAATALPQPIVLPAPAAIGLPMFRVPRAKSAAAEGGLLLHIERDANGRLRQLHADITDRASAASEGAAAQPPSRVAADTDGGAGIDDWLLDLSAIDTPVRSLEFGLLPVAEGSLNARIEIAGSNELENWQMIAPAQAIVSLHQGEFRLQRLQAALPYAQWRYLRLRRVDSDVSLPLASVTANFAHAYGSVADQRLDVILQGNPVPDHPGVFEYRLTGPFPIERAAVELAQRNALATIILETRDFASQPWREHASGTAFRLAGGDEDVGAAPFELPIIRDRFWRLRSEPALAQAPALKLGYQQESFVLLAQGAGPYRLVAGSLRAARPDYPLQVVLSQLAAHHGHDWQPDEIVTGAGTSLAGEAALSLPPAPPPYRQWLLWTVLVGAAGLIMVLVIKLLRESKAA
ncbi:MAG: DUF3999 family protein [Pseudomarimonas sp.]